MNKQRGIAIITVMLALALAALICSEVVVRVFYSMNRAEQLLHLQQAEQYALAGEAWGRQLLAKDYINGKANSAQIDHFDESWAETGLTRTMTGGELAMEVNDMQACFNLNSLVDAEGNIVGENVDGLNGMLNFLGIGMQYADFAARWISNADDSDDRYNTDEYPYRAADTLMGSPKEIQLLRDITTDEYDKLLPHVCTLPQPTAININTATEPVLASLFVGENANSKLQQFLSRRQQQRFFTSVEEFGNFLGNDADDDDLESSVTVASDYFRIRSKVTYQDRTVRLESLVFRHPETGEISLIGRDWRAEFEMSPPRETDSSGRGSSFTGGGGGSGIGGDDGFDPDFPDEFDDPDDDFDPVDDDESDNDL